MRISSQDLDQGQIQSWRAGVLQSLAPTCLNTPLFICIYLFSHLADAFIQSDLQMRTL